VLGVRLRLGICITALWCMLHRRAQSAVATVRTLTAAGHLVPRAPPALEQCVTDSCARSPRELR
jgi:hypothetical protein